MSKENEITDADLNAYTHRAKIAEFDKKLVDFEERIRHLETYKNKHEGFVRANWQWLSIVGLWLVTTAIQIFRT